MSNKPVKSLGEIIKEALKEKGLNQSAIAKKMNVSKQVINQIDRRKYFDLEFLQSLRDVTGLDFTGYSYITKPQAITHSAEPSSSLRNNQQVEMSLAIKLKADADHISQMGEFLLTIKKEASRLGFTII